MLVNDTNVKVEARADSVNGSTNGANPRFDLPLINLQEFFRNFAEQGTTRAKDNIEKVKAASEEVSEVVREACFKSAESAADYGAKVIEISKHNTSATLEFMSQLAETRSLLDIVNLSATRSREAFEVATAQNRELWELAQKVATETTAPMKTSFNRLLHRPV
ncbi:MULTISPECIES: phasin [unclassified Bradyrhizobium]|uniref:phasin n=1 Tax=unclassified Bradyrhizobium TaxID=2631580 RepID=UPI001FFA6545|nr:MULTISPECIES: phasin [unclassified Bradyrhizobium]